MPSVRSGWPMLPYWVCRVKFFWLGRVFWLWVEVFGWVGFWVKNHGLYPDRGLLRYDPYLPVALIRSSFLGEMGRDGWVGKPMIRSSSWSRCERRGGEPEVGRGGLEEACQLLGMEVAPRWLL
jgi:hypothetical protein